ncbi:MULTISPECIES: PspA-associated protein PspAA [Brevibacterium]|uniref:PspA-associated domain-containing protein n=1 Tax=Brevibacterium salitolerans TaxID=1403566 RepID=A0ABN2WKD9_9MICO|nr:hypothetical protein [Brevibacterium sp.]
MIIRILGEGQFDLTDVDEAALQSYDDEVEKAFEAGDENAVHTALTQLHDFITAHGSPVADDFLGASDVVVPGTDATIAEIQELLSGEGFVPNGG